MDAFRAGDPFAGLHACDGFHVRLIDSCGLVSLYAEAWQGGLVCNLWGGPADCATVLVASWPAAGAAAATAGRLQLVLEAACRYLNTGGHWDELLPALGQLRVLARGGLAFPGYDYLESNPVPDDVDPAVFVYQHVWVRDDGSGAAAVWQEPPVVDGRLLVHGGAVWPSTLDEVRRQQEEDDGDDAPDAADAAAADPGPGPALPAP